MKFLAIFMTVLIFASGLDLCADTGSCASNGTTTELHASDNERQQTKTEMCSPFCNCARCPFSILLPEKIKGLNTVYFLENRFNYLVNAAPLGISSSIWQPPKTA